MTNIFRLFELSPENAIFDHDLITGKILKSNNFCCYKLIIRLPPFGAKYFSAKSRGLQYFAVLS